MDRIAKPKNTKEIIEKNKFRFSKSLGQNFLIDMNILERIIEGSKITNTDYVLEIGPGIGSLTQYIADKAQKVIAVEIDTKLISILEKTLQPYNNVEIIHGDILKIDLDKIAQEKFENQKFKVIANLPYYLTTPIIMRLLEGKLPISSITVMIQEEVGRRLGAQPSTKEYGALSIAVQYYCQTKQLLRVPPSVFIPQPKVDSVVIHLDVLENPRVHVDDETLFFKIVKDAFGKRRKTLLNALSTGDLAFNKDFLRQVLQLVEIDGSRRGETLSIDEFAKLANAISKKL